MTIDVVSIIYLVIIALSILVGIKRGLFKMLTSLIKDILSFILSIFLAKPFASLLTSSSLGVKLSLKFENLLIEKNSQFGTLFSESNKDAFIDLTLEQLNLPEKIIDLLSNLLSNSISFEASQQMTMAQAISPIITYYIFLVIAFILIFIVVRIVARLLNKLFKYLEQIPLIKIVNRLTGAVLGLIIGVLLVSLISYGLTFIIPLDLGISSWLVDNMKLNEETFTISKYLYNENVLLIIITYIQNLIS